MTLLWLGITPKTDVDRDNLVRGLEKLLAEGPALAIKAVTGGVVMLGAASEEQLETVVDRLAHTFDVEASVTRLEIAYKEALTRPASGEAKYVRQSESCGEYAHVKIRVEPGVPGSGYVFVNEVTEGAIPGAFISAIHEGIAEALDHGVLHGYPLDDVRVAVYDGSYHDVDSSEAAFREAARLAFCDAARRAQPVLLEPVMNVGVLVPAAWEPAVSSALNWRHGEVLSVWEDSDAPGKVRIAATARLPEMFGFAVDVRRRTQGLGACTMTFSHYAPVAPRDGDDDHDRQAGVTSPLAPRTPLRSLRASVPEPPPDIE